MSAPFIWIIFPLTIAVLLFIIRQAHWLVVFSSVSVCLLMIILSHLVPIDQTIYFGKQTIEIPSEFLILGRRLLIEDVDRPLIGFIYSLGLCWFFVSGFFKTNDSYIPVGLASIALWAAALSVQPFLYAILIVEVVVLVSIPILIQPGEKPGQGILKYLIYQTLAVPFMLFAGWVASGAEANPADEQLVFQTAMLLGIGFSFLLAVFPFSFWVPNLVNQTHPLLNGFILITQPIIILLLGVNYLNTYAWLRDLNSLPVALVSVGGFMVVLGGFLAASQGDLRRIFAFLVILENGFGVMSLSLVNHVGVELLLLSFFPRLVSLGIFSLALAVLHENGISMKLSNLNGILLEYPFTGGAIILAMLSLAGMPVLAGFPIRQMLSDNLAISSIAYSVVLTVGRIGLLIGGLRIFGILRGMKAGSWKVNESRSQVFLLILGIVILFVMGILPGILYSQMVQILQAFPNLG